MANETNTWPELAIALFEKLNERDAEITCELGNMEVWVSIPIGEKTSSAPREMNRTIKIRTGNGVSI